MSGALAKAHAHGGVAHAPSLAVRLGLDSGIHRLLETPLAINGLAPTPTFALVGSDALAATWPTRAPSPAMTLAAGVNLTVLGQETPYLDGNTAPTTTGTEYYVFPSAVTNVGVEDWLLELAIVFRSFPANAAILSSYVAPDSVYLDVYTSGAGIKLAASGAGGTASVTGGTITLNAVNLCHLIYDKSGTARLYVNAAASGSAATVSGVGALTLTRSPGLLARPNGGIPCSATLLWMQLQRGSGWLDDSAQATVVSQRLALLTASRPSFSVVPSTYPTAAGSTSPVYQQRRLASGADQLFYMGVGAPTFDRIVDAAGRAHVGHLVEIARPNVALQSQVAGTSRTAVNASVAASNSDTAPDGTVTADTLTASADGGYLKQAYAAITAVSRTASYWVRRNGVANVAGKLQIVKTSDASTIAEVAFTATALWQKVQIKGTCVLNDTECRLVINANGGSLFIWQEDFIASDRAGSPVVTTTGAVTAAASSLKYSIANCFPRSEGSLVGAILTDGTFTPDRARVFASLDDGSANNRIELFTTATTGLLSALSRKAAGTDGDVELTAHGSVFDNKPRPFLLTWNAAELALWVKDPTTHQWSVARDTSFTVIPGATLTVACIGHDNAVANHSGPGGYLLADWAVCPQHFDHPSQVRRADSISWEGY